MEYYERDLRDRTRIMANLNYALNAIQFIKSSNMKSEEARSSVMLMSGIKTGYRNALKHKFFSLLNLSGLVIGITTSLFLLVYILDELSYDTFHVDSELIYRVTDEIELEKDFTRSAIVPSMWADGFSTDIPEIESIARIRPVKRFNPVVKYKDRVFTETSFIDIDSTLLNVFTYDFVHKVAGNPLSIPDAVILSDRMAMKYFGDLNPIGEVIEVNDLKMTVTGMFRKRANDSFAFDFAGIFDGPGDEARWVHTLIKLKPNTDAGVLSSKLTEYVRSSYEKIEWLDTKIELQPLIKIHHYSDLKFEYGQNSSIIYIYLFSVVSVMVLLITLINFVNLTTSKATSRMKEIGIRKVAGATRFQISVQVLAETLFYVLTASIIAILLLFALMPYFNDFTQKEINLLEVLTPAYWSIIFATIVLLSFSAGIYPAVLLSTLTLRSHELKGTQASGSIRKALVVIQFALSSLMIMGAIVVTRQLELFQNNELGFDKASTLILRVADDKVREAFREMKGELNQISGINSVSFTQTFPGEREKMAVLVFNVEGMEDVSTYPTFLTDFSFTQALEIELLAGRHFDETRPADKNAILINEKAAAGLGWTPEEAIGKNFKGVHLPIDGNVIGVTTNFNINSLHNDLEAVVIAPVTFFPRAFNAAIINFNSNPEDILPAIETTWRGFSEVAPFDHTLLDDNLQTLYRQDFTKGKIFRMFVLLTIVLSCIGLFGLTFYTLDKRTKEISIRKVLGASTQNITLLMGSTFIKLVLIANLIAIPLAYLASNQWLQEFSYRINLTVDVFLIGAFLSLLISISTIVYLTIKKALINPAKQLKCE